MKKITSFFLIVFTFNCLFSQNEEAELFFNDGTSIKGFAKITKTNQVKFKISPDHKADFWNNEMIKSVIIYDYNLANKYEYIFLKPNKSAKILKVLTEGNVNLYAKIETTYSSINSGLQNNLPMNRINMPNESIRYFVKKTDETYPTELTGIKGFRTNAKNYFSDCKGIIEKLIKREFGKHNSIEIVDYYNDFCAE